MGTVEQTAATACPLAGTTTPCRVCNADADCGANQFCECRPGTCSKTGGTCVAKPSACPEYYAPVCGCDGTTFPNDCFRRAASACRAHDGACGPSCQTDGDCNDGNLCTVDRCVNGACEHDCVCLDPTSGNSCCGPGPICVTTTTTTTLPPQCTSDGDCNDGDFCSADRCVNGVCEHACICAAAGGGLTCCLGPSALCVAPKCGAVAAIGGTCGGSCPFRATCEPAPTATAVDAGCRCVSGEGGPCGGNIDAPPAVCAPGLVCQQPNPDVTGVCVVPGCVPISASGCTQTSDCCEPCSRLGRAPCGVCIQGVCSGAP